ncbi:hypothetical protein BD410DRAFT_739394 [Rickenella mellea]|uniref:Uncharacterized protein n=1 Tax=Rickenella mellea TaxID=50990 RepID=A0A4Y7QLT7_9AGAM|nr:hypothetical protein BD410DRAFT_739394 [Rickenella mellea]
MTRWRVFLPWLLAGLCVASAYEVPISDSDDSYQVCSGMWAGSSTYINITFDSSSQGNLAVVLYEWKDNEILGKVTSMSDDGLPQKTFVCTSDAVKANFCNTSQLGTFILDLPEGMSINDTSFWSARVGFRKPSETARTTPNGTKTDDFWNNPEGNPTPPAEPYTSPWRYRSRELRLRQSPPLNPSPVGTLWYEQPIQYQVRKTGYYCAAIVPVTVLTEQSQSSTDVSFHPSYRGSVHFHNVFHGELPATDYPKVNFYFSLFLVYTVLGGAWGWLCWKHKEDLLPMQYYLSSLVGFLIIEMVANWAYYRYLNAHGRGTASTVFLIVVAILDAGRNALSFFLLLIVSMGLSVVRESLESTMRKCQLLAGAHFVFGVLYAVGIVELELESTSALVLLLFVIPLSFTLSGFLLWIMYALNSTIAQLAQRKQRYKLKMFQRLHRILLMVVFVIAIFFVVSSLSFSNRLAEDYASKSWKVRWWLLDGWLALLYLSAFASIAYIWRPTGSNRRLAMSEELAQEDEDAEDYDLEAIERRVGDRDDDEATLVGRRGPASVLSEDAVVFEIGDQELSDDEDNIKTPQKRRSDVREEGNGRIGVEGERDGLMGREDTDD